jgi:tetratricopeptide (TPR) repeat protein
MGRFHAKYGLRIFQLVLLLFWANTISGNVDSLIRAGNDAYNNGRYDNAIEAYEKVTDKGYTSAELYYNLGNAYFKLNDVAASILYYEKAKRLDPRNEDILFNLALAKSRTIDRIEPVPELFYVTWWKQLKNLLSPDNWAIASISGFVLVWIFAIIFFISRKVTVKRFSFWSGIVVILLTTVLFIITHQKYEQLRSEAEAIIFTPTVTVKSSPNEKSVDLFVVHEGTKVEITDAVEDWNEIRIADGSKGWVKSSTFRII